MTIPVFGQAPPSTADKTAPPGDAQPAAAAQATVVPVVIGATAVATGAAAGASAGAAQDQQPAEAEQVATPGGGGAKRRRSGDTWFSGTPGSGQAGAGVQTQRRKESHNATEQKRRQVCDSFRLALPHSGWPTVLRLIYWLCGTHPSNFGAGKRPGSPNDRLRVGGVPREQKMLERNPPRVIYHETY